MEERKERDNSNEKNGSGNENGLNNSEKIKGTQIKFSPSALKLISNKLKEYHQSKTNEPTNNPNINNNNNNLGKPSNEGDVNKQSTNVNVNINNNNKNNINVNTTTVNNNNSNKEKQEQIIQILQTLLPSNDVNNLLELFKQITPNTDIISQILNPNSPFKQILSTKIVEIMGKPDISGPVGDFLLTFLELTVYDLLLIRQGDFTSFNQLLNPLYLKLNFLLDNSITVESIQRLSQMIVGGIGSDFHEELLPPNILVKIKENQNLTQTSLSVLLHFIPSLFNLISQSSMNNNNHNNNNNNNKGINNNIDRVKTSEPILINLDDEEEDTNNNNNNNKDYDKGTADENVLNNEKTNKINEVIKIEFDFGRSLKEWAREFVGTLISSISLILKGGEVDAMEVLDFFFRQRLALLFPQLQFLADLILNEIKSTYNLFNQLKRKRSSAINNNNNNNNNEELDNEFVSKKKFQ